MIVLALAVLCSTAMAAGPIVGLDYGYIMSDAKTPAFAYRAYTDISTIPLTGKICDKVEVSGLYSDRPWGGTSQTYAVTTMALKSVNLFPHFHAAFGSGVWYVVNTDGQDATNLGVEMSVGFSVNQFRVKLSGDVIDFDNEADWYLVSFGASLDL
jgi:hypothetical protein